MIAERAHALEAEPVFATLAVERPVRTVPEGVARANPDVVVRDIDVEVKRQVGLAYSTA